MPDLNHTCQPLGWYIQQSTIYHQSDWIIFAWYPLSDGEEFLIRPGRGQCLQYNQYVPIIVYITMRLSILGWHSQRRYIQHRSASPIINMDDRRFFNSNQPVQREGILFVKHKKSSTINIDDQKKGPLLSSILMVWGDIYCPCQRPHYWVAETSTKSMTLRKFGLTVVNSSTRLAERNFVIYLYPWLVGTVWRRGVCLYHISSELMKEVSLVLMSVQNSN